jgi:MFS family permease
MPPCGLQGIIRRSPGSSEHEVVLAEPQSPPAPGRSPPRPGSPSWYWSYALFGASAAGLSPILLPVLVAMRDGAGEVGLVMAALNLGVLSSPLWGTIADRYRGHRALYFLGILLVVLSLAGFTLRGPLGYRLVLALIQGLGIGGVNTMASLFVVEFEPRQEWTRLISRLQTLNGLGQAAGTLLAGIFSQGGTQAAGLWVAALLLVPALWLGRRGLPAAAARRHVPRTARQAIGGLARMAERLSGAVFYAIQRPSLEYLFNLVSLRATPFGRFLSSWLLFSIGSSAFFTFYPLLMVHAYGIRLWAASAVLAALTAARLPLFGPSGALCRRYGSRAIFRVFLVIRGVSFLGLFILAYFRGPAASALTFLLLSVMTVAWPLGSVSATELSAELAVNSEGEAMGLFNAASAAASLAGALLGGGLVAALGYGSIAALAAACCAGALVLASWRK